MVIDHDEKVFVVAFDGVYEGSGDVAVDESTREALFVSARGVSSVRSVCCDAVVAGVRACARDVVGRVCCEAWKL